MRAVRLRVLVSNPLVVVGHVLRGSIPVPVLFHHHNRCKKIVRVEPTFVYVCLRARELRAVKVWSYFGMTAQCHPVLRMRRNDQGMNVTLQHAQTRVLEVSIKDGGVNMILNDVILRLSINLTSCSPGRRGWSRTRHHRHRRCRTCSEDQKGRTQTIEDKRYIRVKLIRLPVFFQNKGLSVENENTRSTYINF